ncbi:hypothetical protein HDV57DRAFT_460987 [Trichoderma longibrachiatum]
MEVTRTKGTPKLPKVRVLCPSPRAHESGPSKLPMRPCRERDQYIPILNSVTAKLSSCLSSQGGVRSEPMLCRVLPRPAQPLGSPGHLRPEQKQAASTQSLPTHSSPPHDLKDFFHALLVHGLLLCFCFFVVFVFSLPLLPSCSCAPSLMKQE